MIYFKTGDIFRSDAEALVNPVNCVGVMGKGLALQFKERYPENYLFYRKSCEDGKMTPGSVLTYAISTDKNPKFIINFPTKRHWKTSSRIGDIYVGLLSMSRDILQLNIKSIAVPALGCGLGNLDRAEVRPMMINLLDNIPETDFYFYEPL